LIAFNDNFEPSVGISTFLNMMSPSEN